MDQSVVPAWLPGFVETKYFTECHEHIHQYSKRKTVDDSRVKTSDQDYYCITCATGPLCLESRRLEHGEHQVLKVRKASHRDAVRVNDITNLFDIEHIQTYSINSSLIVFLPSRPQVKCPQRSPTIRSHCRICTRGLRDEWGHFCSLSCKLKAIINSPPDAPDAPDASLTCDSNGAAMHNPASEERRAVTGDCIHAHDASLTCDSGGAAMRNSASEERRAVTGDCTQTNDKMLPSSSRPAADGSPTSVLPIGDYQTEPHSFRKRSRKNVPVRAAGVGVLCLE